MLAKLCTRTLRRLLALGSVMAACALPVLKAAASDVPGVAAPVHVTQAHVRAEAGAGWSTPARPPALVADSDGEPIALPHARPRVLAASPDTLQAPPEVVWYRLAVPPTLREGLAPQTPLFLYLPRWQTIGTIAIYADDRLVYHSTGSRIWNSFNRPLWAPLTQDGQASGVSQVWLRMASQPGVGGAVSTAWIGTEDGLLWRWRWRTWLQDDLVAYSSAAFVVIGLFALGVWWLRRDEPMYAWFFAASVAHAIRMAHYTMGDQAPPLPDDWFGWLSANALDWSMVCLVAVAARVHRLPMARLATAVMVAVAAKTVFTMPVIDVLPPLASRLPLAYLVTGALFLLVFFAALWPSHARRSREGLALFAVVGLNVPAAVHDFKLQTYALDIEGVYLTPYTSIAMFALFLVLAWRRYMGALASAEAASAGLEQRLAARERELVRSHEQLRELERQQTLASERQRMMQDMHDGIGSSLISALRMVQHGHLSSGDTAQILKDCIDDLKLAIDSLEPADADLLALLAAVRFRLGPRLQAAGITLAWNVQDLPPLHWLDARSALHVLRIVQEVLTNILKHSGATRIEVSTTQLGAEVLLRVRDNGRPFAGEEGRAAPASGVVHGKGLANIRMRVQALEGRCAWAAPPGATEGGGEFSLWLPVTRPPAVRPLSMP